MVALIRVESAGNPDAISRVGARGLTQVMPATGFEIAQDLGVQWEGDQMLHDVEISVRFGTYYMSKLLARFEGNIHAAVAAYNWGPDHIAKRLRNGQPLPVRYPGKVLGHVTVAQVWASS
jgi:soluble lytic murein transglycosylase